MHDKSRLWLEPVPPSSRGRWRRGTRWSDGPTWSALTQNPSKKVINFRNFRFKMWQDCFKPRKNVRFASKTHTHPFYYFYKCCTVQVFATSNGGEKVILMFWKSYSSGKGSVVENAQYPGCGVPWWTSNSPIIASSGHTNSSTLYSMMLIAPRLWLVDRPVVPVIGLADGSVASLWLAAGFIASLLPLAGGSAEHVVDIWLEVGGIFFQEILHHLPDTPAKRNTNSLKWQFHEIFGIFLFMNPTHLGPDKQAKMDLLKESFSRRYSTSWPIKKLTQFFGLCWNSSHIFF